jgi:hypothetical protein
MVFACAIGVTSRDSQAKRLRLRKASMLSQLASQNKLLVESITMDMYLPFGVSVQQPRSVLHTISDIRRYRVSRV